jgi:hypothetical protein
VIIGFIIFIDDNVLSNKYLLSVSEIQIKYPVNQIFALSGAWCEVCKQTNKPKYVPISVCPLPVCFVYYLYLRF